MRKFLFILGYLTFSCAHSSAERPLPVPHDVIVETSNPRRTAFNKLTAKDKSLLYHLNRAARIGHELLFDQRHRHGHVIKDFFENAFASEAQSFVKSTLSDEGFKEFLIYGLMFLDVAGPYDARSNTKYVLQKSSREAMATLWSKYSPEIAKDKKTMTEILDLFFDETYEVSQRADRDNLAACGSNLYPKGLDKSDIEDAVKSGLHIDLNSKLAIDSKGKLASEPQTVKTAGIVGKTLDRIVTELQAALSFCSTEEQCQELSSLITYYKEGNVEDFREASIAWVRDGAESAIDFSNGWIEVYEDYRGSIGSWSSVLVLVDPTLNQKAHALAKNAQYFESKMPYGPYKKTFPENYAPPAIVAPYFLELTSFHSGGFNLPNFDDIRASVGFKNVIRLPFPELENDPQYVAKTRESLLEFMPTALVDNTVKLKTQVWMNLVMMHEIIGHGSGTFKRESYPEKVDPVSGLSQEIGASLASALEEQRADLTALVFVDDKKLVDIGIYKNKEEAEAIKKAMYDFYLADLLIRFARDQSFAEPHSRGHLLFVNYLLKNGGAKWVGKDGTDNYDDKTRVLAVSDYQRFQDNARKLLSMLQQMKAEKESEKVKATFQEYADLAIESEPWTRVMIQRAENLRYKWPVFSQVWDIDADAKAIFLYGDDSLEALAANFSKMVSVK